jgi:hypothetical protein
MATPDIKFETLITSGFPELNRFRLKVHEVVMEPGDYPEHTHCTAEEQIIHQENPSPFLLVSPRRFRPLPEGQGISLDAAQQNAG